jgi:hypothetical protein
MPKRRSKRRLKKNLRLRERALSKDLDLFLNGFDAEQPLDSETNFRLLLKLRWLIYEFIYVRLKLNRKWMRKKWFLELFDVDHVQISDDEVKLTGDIVWWAEGKDAAGEWWFPDSQLHQTAVYKVKIRGDLDGGHWVLEPMTVNITQAKSLKHDATYEIDFGKGYSFLKIKSR